MDFTTQKLHFSMNFNPSKLHFSMEFGPPKLHFSKKDGFATGAEDLRRSHFSILNFYIYFSPAEGTAYSILPTTFRLGPAFSWARTEGWCMSFGK